MTTTTGLGTWRQPPLAYVVAELAISPYYSMASKIAGLQDQLRESFPRTLEANELVIDGAKPSSQPLWRFISAEQTHGVQIGTRAISLHATSYIQSSDFLSRWAEILDTIQAEALNPFIERVGLRYIDLIVGSDERPPSDYLAQGLRGVSLDGAHSAGSMWAAAFQFEKMSVNLRAAAPAPQGMLLPPDFNALPLGKSPIMMTAEKWIKKERPIGFVDTDCVKAIGRVFNAIELSEIYGEMQKLASRTFKSVLSNFAKKEWV